MNKSAVFFGLIAIVCLGCLVWGHYNDWRRKRAAAMAEAENRLRDQAKEKKQ